MKRTLDVVKTSVTTVEWSTRTIAAAHPSPPSNNTTITKSVIPDSVADPRFAIRVRVKLAPVYNNLPGWLI